MTAYFTIISVRFNQTLSLLKHLRQIEKKMREDLQTNKKKVVLSPHKMNSELINPKSNQVSDILQNVIQIIEENGFTIQALKPPELKGTEENIFPVQVLLNGPVIQFVSLLTHLSQANWTTGIHDFSFQIVNNDEANIEMTLLVLKQTANASAIAPKNLSEPFKVIGYVHDDKKFYALLLLPDGKTQIVKQGSNISNQNARVIGLSENEVIISQGQQSRPRSYKLSP
jgi:hypothetical protein